MMIDKIVRLFRKPRRYEATFYGKPFSKMEEEEVARYNAWLNRQLAELAKPR